ncbi:MAG: putative sugar nucleotidyl transferase [Balneolaceae bacterium]
MGRRNHSISICFFEDDQCSHFHPLTLTRPMDDLRIGMYTIREKWLYELKSDSFMRTGRPELKDLFPSERNSGNNVFWINSRLLPDARIIDQILNLSGGEFIASGEVPLAFRTDDATTGVWLDKGIRAEGFRKTEAAATPPLLEQLWDLLKYNPDEIERDIDRTDGLNRLKPDAGTGIYITGRQPVYTGADVTIEPGVSFVTSGGPVYIGTGATIMAGSAIRGPAVICRGSTVKMGAKIYGNSTVGPVCKIGGEINNVIFHSYSNKAHDGYAGNSIFGQWCNLGADTNTSNLKNNYGTIRFTDWHTRRERNTGELFLGTVMADHSKTGINSMLNTGTSCGVCCNLFSHGYPPKLIPSFSWVNSEDISVYLFDKALQTMKRTMARRDVVMSDSYAGMMRKLFDNRIT